MKRWAVWAVTVMLLLGVVTGVCSCKKKDRTEETETEETSRKKKKSDNKEESKEDPKKGKDREWEEPGGVDPDSIAGIWCDEHGPVLRITPNKRTFEVFRDGLLFTITDIDDTGISVVISDDTITVKTEMEKSNPFFSTGTEFYLPMSVNSDGYMNFLGMELFRTDTQEGMDLTKKIETILFADAFYIGEEETITVSPTEITMEVEGETVPQSIQYHEGLMDVGGMYFLDTMYTFLPDPDKDDLMICYYTFSFLNEKGVRDVQWLVNCASWVVYIPGSGELQIWEDEDDRELVARDLSGNEIERHKYMANGLGNVELEGSDSILRKLEDGMCMERQNKQNETDACFYASWTLTGRLYLLREQVLSGQKKNTVFTKTEFAHMTETEKTTVTLDLAGKNVEDVWLPDYGVVSFVDKGALYYWDEGRFLSDGIKISADDAYVGAKIRIEVNDPEVKVENVELVKETYSGLIRVDCPITRNGDYLEVEYDASEEGTYILIDKTEVLLRDLNFDVKTLLETDPHDSYWANVFDTGDIPDLVDMEYIRASITDMEKGSAVFWVSTPEQLASVNYYVNALDAMQGDDLSTMYYVHLLNDIDLSAYEWAPMGNRARDRNTDAETVFRGVFFGNGYKISGLRIEDPDGAFFRSCHMATVIGLTLDHPNIGNGNPGRTIHCFNEGLTCITEYFDCCVIIDPSQKDYYEFADHDNKSINFFDCSFYMEEGGNLEEIGLGSDYEQTFYNGYDNWIRRYYTQSDSTYHYDAEREYTDFSVDSEPFIDMYYYYGGQPAPTHVGYLGFTGWIVNDEFYVNYGYVNED